MSEADALWNESFLRVIHLDCSRPGRVVLRVKSEQLVDAQLVGLFPDEASARAAARRVLDASDHVKAANSERALANEHGL